MKVSSIKAKGKRLENKVASLWRGKVDKTAIRTPGSGSGKFKSDIFNNYYMIECKNQERVNLWEFWQQARKEGSNFKPPVLMVSGNHRPILAIMDIDDWLNLVKEAKIE